jgi:hypothetical protein
MAALQPVAWLDRLAIALVSALEGHGPSLLPFDKTNPIASIRPLFSAW